MAEGDDADKTLVDNIKLGATLLTLPARVIDKVLKEPILSVVAVGLIAIAVYIIAFMGPEIMSSVQGRYDNYLSETKKMVKDHDMEATKALKEQREDLLKHNDQSRADYLDSIKGLQDATIKAQATQTESVKEAVKDLRETVKELGKGALNEPAVPPPAVVHQ